MLTTTLCMIVRDEEGNLPACLDSVRGLFDEAVIVDTGSKDATVKIAKRFGARVFHFEWIDDFAAARNHGLDRVRTDYVFRMDADDRLAPGSRKRLRRVLESLRPDWPETHVCRVFGHDSEGFTATADEHRLWPNHPDIRFFGTPHDRIDPERYATRVQSGVRIEHVGYSDPATAKAKIERNLRILMQEQARGSTDPYLHYDLARTKAGAGDSDGAILHFLEFLDGSPKARGTLMGRMAWRSLVGVYRNRGDVDGRVDAITRGLAAYPRDPVLLAFSAEVLEIRGHIELAREGYQHAIAAYDPHAIDSCVVTDFVQQIQGAIAALP